MNSKNKELILKIIGYLILIIVLLIFGQYLLVLQKRYQNQKYSSQTIDTITENDQLIMTEIDMNENQKFMDNVKKNLVLEITSKLKDKLESNVEKFMDTPQCKLDLTQNIYYLFLETKLLELPRFKPRPIWTNQHFCLYKIQPVLSLDTSISMADADETDYYYPLGDILLFKNYADYITNYQSRMDKIAKSREIPTCKNPEENSNNNNSNNKNSNNNNSNNNNSNNNGNNNNSNNKNSNNNANNNSNNNANNNSNNNANNNANNNSNNNSNKNSNKNANNNASNNSTVKSANGASSKDVPPPDTFITNYDQPGLDGLKILIKNGKKPMGFEPNAVCVITGSNGENLYFWRPIAPPSYVFLGDVITIGVTPVPPKVDDCQIRCIPQECVDNVPFDKYTKVVSEDILPPYQVKMVSNGKYFRGLIEMGTHDNLQSYEFNTKCLNVERDQEDLKAKIDITMSNTNGSGGAATNQLTEGDFNILLQDFMAEITKKLILDETLKLNNVLNNQNIDSKVFNVENMRFTLQAKFLVTNQFIITIMLKKRAYAYGEILTEQITNFLQKNFKSILSIKTRIGGKDYNLEPIAISINNIGITQEEKKILSALEVAIAELETQINLEKEKNILDYSIINQLDMLLLKLNNLQIAIIDNLTYKKKLGEECHILIESILKELEKYEVPDLKKVLQDLIKILTDLNILITEGKDTASGNMSFDDKFQIDKELRSELETLGKLALRDTSDRNINLGDFFKYDGGLGLNNLETSISKLKENL